MLEASASVFTNKYSEGYPGKRYYEGQQFVDPLEELAIDRAKALFGAAHANVQPYSGSPANLAVYLAFLKPGDKVMGLALPMGGHLTHGWNVSITGKYFTSVPVRRPQGHRPHRLRRGPRPGQEGAPRPALGRRHGLLAPLGLRDHGARSRARWAPASAPTSRTSPGSSPAASHPSPVPHADVVTTTTHKTLRGPRGGMILCRAEHAPGHRPAVFPGLQGGPHVHNTAALAVALQRGGRSPTFKDYAKRVVANAKRHGRGR